METTILALASLGLATALAVVGVAGLVARLPRDERRRARYRAAAPSLIAAAGPPLLLGVALVVRSPEQPGDWFLAYALAGAVTGGLIALARRRADLATAGPPGEAPAQEEERA